LPVETAHVGRNRHALQRDRAQHDEIDYTLKEVQLLERCMPECTGEIIRRAEAAYPKGDHALLCSRFSTACQADPARDPPDQEG
jgi:hypothetical protein